MPEFKSLRTRWTWGLGSVLVALAAIALYALHHREMATASSSARARSEAIVRSTSAWVDGDAHERLTTEHPTGSIGSWDDAPEELVRGCDDLRGATAINLLEDPVRTLRLRDELKGIVAAAPGRSHSQALEVVLSGDDDLAWRATVDYTPEMAPALFESKSFVHEDTGHLTAYAPVLDSWDQVVGLAVVESSIAPPLVGYVLRASLAVLSTIGLLTVLIKGVDRFVRRHCEALGTLASEAERLLANDRTEVVTQPASSWEMLRLAYALEAWRVGPHFAAEAPGAPVRAADAAPAPAPAPAPPKATSNPVAGPVEVVRVSEAPAEETPSGDRSMTFDVGLLLEQAVEPFRKRARQKGVEIRMIVAEHVPRQIEADPEALLTGISSLLRNSVNHTKNGCITVRVSRVRNSHLLRFEVSDEGDGVAWQHQPRLDQLLGRAAGADPRRVEAGLQRTSALATRMGGEVRFSSQPGHGSRFWFTATFAHPHTSATAPRGVLPRKNGVRRGSSILRRN